MAPRQAYAASAILVCATFALAGVAGPLSKLVQDENAAWWLEGVSGTSMVIGILAACFWYPLGRRLKAGALPTVSACDRTSAFGLFAIMLAIPFVTSVYPIPSLDFVQLCSPLAMPYLIWSVWKTNDASLIQGRSTSSR
jgi:hypothetical protein